MCFVISLILKENCFRKIALTIFSRSQLKTFRVIEFDFNFQIDYFIRLTFFLSLKFLLKFTHNRRVSRYFNLTSVIVCSSLCHYSCLSIDIWENAWYFAVAVLQSKVKVCFYTYLWKFEQRKISYIRELYLQYWSI